MCLRSRNWLGCGLLAALLCHDQCLRRPREKCNRQQLMRLLRHPETWPVKPGNGGRVEVADRVVSVCRVQGGDPAAK